MHSKIKIALILLCLIFLAPLVKSQLYAQSPQKTNLITLTGQVLDEQKEPLIGATVKIDGEGKGTITDIEGRYKLDVSPTANLIFSYIGYEPQKVFVNSRTHINVTLKYNQEHMLAETVVIGYGSVKKEDLTGSVVNVKMADIQDVPVLSVDHALQGRIAGADIMATSGEPGASTSIRIRGTRSITASNEPLIVVDGVMDGVSDLSDINPADIEAISVLKDASSTAIYGSRGSNGVIIITTKSGKSGKPNISFKSELGFSQLPRHLDLMNATEFAQFRNDYAYFATSDGYGEIGETSPQSKFPYPNPWEKGKGTNWVDEITRTAIYQSYNLSLSGGSKNSTYFASFGFNDEQGIIKESGVKRYTGRLNLTHQLFSWMKLGAGISYTNRDINPNLVTIGGTNWWNAAIYLSPLLKAYDNFNDLWYSGQKFNSPQATLKGTERNEKRDYLNTSISMEIEPIKDLKIKTQGTYYYNNLHDYRFESETLPAKLDGEGSYAYRREWDQRSMLGEATVAYKRVFNKDHIVDGMVGVTGQDWKSNSLALSGKGFFDPIMWNDLGAISSKENYSGDSDEVKQSKISLLARFNYNYKSRYYLTATGRRDGASNFAANNKYGFFPSFAAKWNMKNETFMDNVHWADEISVRASMGRTGNDGISPYRSLNRMTGTTSGYLFGGKQPVAYYPSRLDSPDLTWEKTDMYTLATDLSLFKNRLNITAEAYLSYTKDLLLDLQVPTQTGYSSRLTNIGKTSNKGIELSVTSRNIVNHNFSWTTSLTMSHNKQMVDDIGTSDFVKAYSSYGNNSYMMYGYVKDYPLNALWGFRSAGVWKNKEEIARNEITKTYISASNALKVPGAPRYIDTNNDGVFNERDLVYLGNADPWLHGGLQNTFELYNFSLSIYLHYSLGGKIYNISEQWMGSGSPFTNQYRFMQNAWHPIRNPESDIPRAGTNDGVGSDRMVYDATFLRLKNISFGYTFTDFKKLKGVIKDIKLSVSGENLYLWKKYNGFDPDVSSNSSNSTLRRVDIGAYPKGRTVIFSLQVRY